MIKHKDRYLAIQEGRKYFLPSNPCCKGHLSLRRVDNYRCVECSGETAIDPVEVKSYISRREATEKGLKVYNSGKPCVKGHLSERRTINGSCVECCSIYSKSQARRESLKNLYKNNDESRKKRAKNGLNWARKNRKTEKGIITDILRNFIGRMISNDKSKTMAEKLGYESNEFRSHIEKQFVDGMSWDNHGEWHIDHIRPISSFYKDNITDPMIINSLSNLQPLWAFENLSKGSKNA